MRLQNNRPCMALATSREMAEYIEAMSREANASFKPSTIASKTND